MDELNGAEVKAIQLMCEVKSCVRDVAFRLLKTAAKKQCLAYCLLNHHKMHLTASPPVKTLLTQTTLEPLWHCGIQLFRL